MMFQLIHKFKLTVSFMAVAHACSHRALPKLPHLKFLLVAKRQTGAHCGWL